MASESLSKDSQLYVYKRVRPDQQLIRPNDVIHKVDEECSSLGVTNERDFDKKVDKSAVDDEIPQPDDGIIMKISCPTPPPEILLSLSPHIQPDISSCNNQLLLINNNTASARCSGSSSSVCRQSFLSAESASSKFHCSSGHVSYDRGGILTGPPAVVSTRNYPVELGKYFNPKPWEPDRYNIIRRLSPAIHGDVQLAIDNSNNETVVIKVVRNSTVRQRRPGELENPLIEMGTMCYLFSELARCPPQFICNLRGVYQCQEFAYMVTDYCTGGELFREVVTRKYFTERNAKAVALQLLIALLSLHNNGIVHRDVSLENTLLRSDRTVCLMDFGQADTVYDEKLQEKKLTGTAGKSYYRAPEMNRCSYSGPPVDVFALGVQIFIMICGSPPWQKADLQDERYRNLTASAASFNDYLIRWKRRDRMSDALVDLLTWIFLPPPSRRPSIQDMLLHPWFAHDPGVWRWVYKHRPSDLLREQIMKVEKFLAEYPTGKYFLRPINFLRPGNTEVKPYVVRPSSGSLETNSSRDGPDRAKAGSEQRSVHRIQNIAKHFRPGH